MHSARIPMRELEKLTVFTRATISFYIHQGILPKPKKSARNMAYYDHEFIRTVGVIEDLKKSGFTLKQIKKMMGPSRRLNDDSRLRALRVINTLLPADEREKPVSRERIEKVGLTSAQIRTLIEMKTIEALDQKGTVFPAYCLTICKFLKYFLNTGIPLHVAQHVIQKLMELAEIETEAFKENLRTRPGEKDFSAEEQGRAFQRSIENINALLPLIHLQLLKHKGDAFRSAARR